MNQRSSGSLVLSKAITGFASFKSAQGLSDRTIDSYLRHLQKWIQHHGDIPIHQILSQDITAYLDCRFSEASYMLPTSWLDSTRLQKSELPSFSSLKYLSV